MTDPVALHERLDELLAQVPAPAVALALITADGGVEYERMRGLADPTRGEQVSPDHWWDLASLTKVFVTVPLVMDLIDEGVVGLDATLAELWPATAGTPVENLRVDRLLSHSSGLPAEVDLWQEPALSRAQRISRLLQVKPVQPPVAPRYSDVGFMLLGEMLAARSGEPLDVLASRHGAVRFGPVDGPAVAYEQCPWRGTLTKGFVHDENAFALGGVAGHAGAFGRFADVVEHCRAALMDTLHATGWLPMATRCWSGDPTSEAYGLGWWMGSTRGVGGSAPAPGSFGATGFVGNRVFVEPSSGFAVVALTNRIHPRRTPPDAFRAWWSSVVDTCRAAIGRPNAGAGDDRSPDAR